MRQNLLTVSENLIRSTWRPLEVEFGRSISRMRENTTRVEREAFACTVRTDEARFKELQELIKGTKISKATLPCHCVPYSENPRFCGRQDVLDGIDKALKPTEARGLRSYALYGIGGVGKTQTALKYGYDHLSDFDAVLWVHADTDVKLSTSFVKIAVALGIRSPDSDPETCRESMLDWFSNTGKF